MQCSGVFTFYELEERGNVVGFECNTIFKRPENPVFYVDGKACGKLLVMRYCAVYKSGV